MPAADVRFADIKRLLDDDVGGSGSSVGGRTGRFGAA
jgi:hypothetical protein